MGKSSRFQDRLKNPEKYLIQKQEFINNQEEIIEKNAILRENRAYRYPNIELKKFQVGYAHGYEDDEKIAYLESIIKLNTATPADYLELDILYLQLEMKQKHNKLWSKINEQFAEASFVPFLEGFYDFFYIRDNFNIKKLFNQAIRQGCTHPLLYTSYGNLYHRENNIKLAKELYHTALKYDSQFSVAWFNLGVFAFAENQRNDAEINFLRSLHGKAHYFKGYFGIFQCIEKKLNSHHILMIPLLFAAYISECQQILNKFSFKVHELEYILHIPLEFQKELIKQFDLIWELYNKMSFEQFWNSRQTFYDDLIKFGAGLEKIVHNKAPSYP